MVRKRKITIAKKCDYCGSTTTQFVITANYLTFCHEGYIGKTTKDCHADYLQERKKEHVRNEQLRKEKEEKNKQKEKKLQEEKIKGYNTINQKLETFYDQVNSSKNKRTYL